MPRTASSCVLAVLAAMGCGCVAHDDPPPEPEPIDGWAFGPERPCATPFAGIDRLREESQTRGLVAPLPAAPNVGGTEVVGRGGALVARDLDRDGDVDLAFGISDGPPRVYRNDGSGHFALADPVPGEAGLEGGGWSIGAVDLDGDRLPELVLTRTGSLVAFPNLDDLRFGEATTLYADPSGEARIYLSAAFGDVDGDGDLDAFLPSISRSQGDQGPSEDDPPAPDWLLRSDGAGRFEPIAELRASPLGSTAQVATFTDRDGDGDLDILVPGDRGPPSAFWRNDGPDDDGVPRLTNDAALIGADLSMGAMGFDAYDWNGDGLPDYCISDARPPRCLASGPNGYVEVAAAMGLVPAVPVGQAGTIGWSFDFADFDADGFMDAVQASGPFRAEEGGALLDWPDLFFHGGPGPTFEEIGAALGFDDTRNHLGLATADFDGDGWLDVVLAGPGTTPALWMNRCGEGAWLEVELLGPPGNTEGYLATVSVETDERTILRELYNLRDQGQGPAVLHFGLGAAEIATRVEVRWPDARVSEASDVPLRRRVIVDHAAAAPGDAPPVGDDDDDEIPTPGPDELLLVGNATALGADAPVEGATVHHSADPAVGGETDEFGRYRLIAPRDVDLEILLEHPDYVPSRRFINTTADRLPSGAVLHFMHLEGSFDTFYSGLLGVTHRPGAATLWVEVFSGGNGLSGASVALSAPFDAAVALGPEGPSPGTVLVGESLFILFGNVTAGPVQIEVTPPGDQICRGRTAITLDPDIFAQVQIDCDPPAP